MSHYIEAIRPQVQKRVSRPTQSSIDRWLGLSNLSRYLLGPNTLNELMERAARSIVEILGLDSCRILILESDGHYCCQKTYYQNSTIIEKKNNLSEPLIVEHALKKVAATQPALIPYLVGDNFSLEVRIALGLGITSHIWLVPLSANSQEIGFLELGKKKLNEVDRYLMDSTHLVDLIASQLSSAIYRIRLNERLTDTSLQMVKALTKTLEVRDTFSGLHSQNMAGLSKQLAQIMGCSEQESLDIYWAALLHDIGKIGVEDRILRKPEPLDEAEWQIMQSHPEIGAKIVQGMTGLDGVAPLILTHHERLDGSGYPKGLKGDQIPLGARIIAVVDSYTAMVEGRIYQPKRTQQEALDELIRLKGIAYDSKVVKLFIRMLEGNT